MTKIDTTSPKTAPWVYLSISMYVAGLIGLNFSETRSFFQFLTPFHLLSSLGILFYFHKDWRSPVPILFFLVYLGGYLVEVAGVHTGLIFGEYQYETTLGWKVFDVPLMIGVNWLMLVYCYVDILSRWGNKWAVSHPTFLLIIRTTIGAILLTTLDYIVEPIAIEQNMWSWANGVPPLQNYLGWLVTSWLLVFLLMRQSYQKQNPMAPWILGLQWAFFLVQWFV